MLKVKVNKDKGGIDKALKMLKQKVQRTGLIKEVRRRQEFTKPSVVKREQKMDAIYKQKKRDEYEN
jgi:small subunit ribosomal protein S21